MFCSKCHHLETNDFIFVQFIVVLFQVPVLYISNDASCKHHSIWSFLVADYWWRTHGVERCGKPGEPPTPNATQSTLYVVYTPTNEDHQLEDKRGLSWRESIKNNSPNNALTSSCSWSTISVNRLQQTEHTTNFYKLVKIR